MVGAGADRSDRPMQPGPRRAVRFAPPVRFFLRAGSTSRIAHPGCPSHPSIPSHPYTSPPTDSIDPPPTPRKQQQARRPESAAEEEEQSHAPGRPRRGRHRPRGGPGCRSDREYYTHASIPAHRGIRGCRWGGLQGLAFGAGVGWGCDRRGMRIGSGAATDPPAPSRPKPRRGPTRTGTRGRGRGRRDKDLTD